MKASPKIELLYFDGCPNSDLTRQLLEETLKEMGISAEIESVEVTDNDSAVSNRFLGSPSVRINGKDIEVEEGPETQYSMRCRIYRKDGGQSGVPSKELLRGSLAKIDSK